MREPAGCPGRSAIGADFDSCNFICARPGRAVDTYIVAYAIANPRRLRKAARATLVVPLVFAFLVGWNDLARFTFWLTHGRAE